MHIVERQQSLPMEWHSADIERALAHSFDKAALRHLEFALRPWYRRCRFPLVFDEWAPPPLERMEAEMRRHCIAEKNRDLLQRPRRASDSSWMSAERRPTIGSDPFFLTHFIGSLSSVKNGWFFVEGSERWRLESCLLTRRR